MIVTDSTMAIFQHFHTKQVQLKVSLTVNV